MVEIPAINVIKKLNNVWFIVINMKTISYLDQIMLKLEKKRSAYYELW